MEFKIPLDKREVNEKSYTYNDLIEVRYDPVKGRVYKIFIFQKDVTDSVNGIEIINSVDRKDITVLGRSIMSIPKLKEMVILNLKNNAPKKLIENINSYLLINKLEE